MAIELTQILPRPPQGSLSVKKALSLSATGEEANWDGSFRLTITNSITRIPLSLSLTPAPSLRSLVTMRRRTWISVGSGVLRKQCLDAVDEELKRGREIPVGTSSCKRKEASRQLRMPIT